MDHISKALERAQAERKSVKDWIKPDQIQVRAQGVADAVRPLGIGRKVDLDRETLKANHVLCGPAFDEPVITDKYRVLRTRCLQLMRPQGWTKVGVTSPGPRAGKTLNAINVALSTARDGNTHVVLIDGDLRQPALAQTLGVEPEVGIIDYVSDRASLEDLLLSPVGYDNLTIVPGRHTEADAEAPEYLKSRRMAELVASLARLSRSVAMIVDLPPVLVGDDVIAVAPLLDCMLLVIDEGATDLEELKHTAELLKGFNLLGTVLNRSTDRSREATGYYQAYHGG